MLKAEVGILLQSRGSLTVDTWYSNHAYKLECGNYSVSTVTKSNLYYTIQDILLATIKEIVVSMTPVFVLMMFIILAFTSIFAILLGRRDDSFFGETSNSFNNGVEAFFSLWFFIFGVWEPINDGDVGEYYLVKYYAFIFTVIIVLILFNYVMYVK